MHRNKKQETLRKVGSDIIGRRKPLLHWRRLRGGFYMVIVVLILTSYYYSLPNPLFNSNYSTVLEDHSGELLGAKIADDGQWRFPVSEEVPEKFKTAIIEFEDNNFYRHSGIDPIAIGRAIVQNYEAGEVVSGASTLSMQVIRLAKENPKRTVWEKLKEMTQATRLELSYSKDEILTFYAAHAPFGGNVVGLEAASWRYFGRTSEKLSWAETAMLAVLPNSPALIHPGRNRDALKVKRDRLLKRLYQKNEIDSLTYQLAILETLPEKPHSLPSDAPHYLAKKYLGNESGKIVHSSIDQKLQQKVNSIVDYHYQQLKANGVHNIGVVVLDVKNEQSAAYVGNTNSGSKHGNQVDVISAPRSTGSILKPFLYMLKLNEGEILPNTLVPDVPSRFSDYSPKNFTRTYSGAVPASEALARSLNVPAVYMLQEFGVPKFHHYLNELGLSSIKNAPEHYGLSLILGGAEASLWEISSTYAALAKQMNEYDPRISESALFKTIDFENQKEGREKFELSPGAIWQTFEAMVEVNRPEGEAFWRRFEGARKVAWKTGTSFGYRDGWAIGITPEYVVGVWVGNADGEGRPNLTGIKTAGPILFDIFNTLPTTTWFNEPVYELEKISVCRLSGHRAGQYCEFLETATVPKAGLKTAVCPFHKLLHLNNEETERVNSSCRDRSEIKTKPWFVLPADQEWYYRKSHPEYKPLPPLAEYCREEELLGMKMIYPFKASSIYVPIELDGEVGKTVFEVAHRIPSAKVFWHLNDQFIGETVKFHQLSISPKKGRHTLVLVDEYGERLEHKFEIVGK